MQEEKKKLNSSMNENNKKLNEKFKNSISEMEKN